MPTYFRVERDLRCESTAQASRIRCYVDAPRGSQAFEASWAECLAVFGVPSRKDFVGLQTATKVDGVCMPRPPEVFSNGRWIKVFLPSAA